MELGIKKKTRIKGFYSGGWKFYMLILVSIENVS
jgi:hypothetical protein